MSIVTVKNFIIGLLGLFFSFFSVEIYADLPQVSGQAPVLSRISYQLSTEQWASTTTAEVLINLDALQDKLGGGDINQYMLQSLNKIAKADWHITGFSRNQDSSGMETVSISAKARVPGGMLSGLRDKAKANSRPGETYTIADIDFTPSLAEMEKAHVQARAVLYGEVGQEINRLNQAYPNQHYFVYSVDFNSQVTPMASFDRVQAPQPMVKMLNAPAAPSGGHGASISSSVENKIVEIATVVIASHIPSGSN